jgi:NADPH:quinone reductase-like Zn-dependent oxidoreductase
MTKVQASLQKEEKQQFLLNNEVDCELIGAVTLIESMNLLNKHGIVCVTQILCKKATLNNFYPIKDIPSCVYLTGFLSNSPNLKLIVALFNHIKQHKIQPVNAKIFSFNQMSDAHNLMENNEANGKIVVVNNQL